MAIYRLETKVIGRQARDRNGKPVAGKERSIVAKAAYRSGMRLNDTRQERKWNFKSRSQEILHSEILAPENASGWMQYDGGLAQERIVRERLWNTIEKAEKRKDSQLAREFILTLPAELNREQQIELVRDWCGLEFTEKGFVSDIALHRSKDGKNPHAHILVTTRPVEGEGFGLKPKTDGKFNQRGAVGIEGKEEVHRWRESWCKAQNNAFEMAGAMVRVDHRSYKDQGVNKIPQPKIGVAAMAMERKGLVAESERKKLARRVGFLNRILPAIRRVEKSGETQEPETIERWGRLKTALNAARERTATLDSDEAPDDWRGYIQAQRTGHTKAQTPRLSR
jgi:ATP-dependent exoDNAse (exonuclease V) alpha subunit